MLTPFFVPRVLLDLRMVEGPLHGIARYALELARRLPALAPDWEFRALVPPSGLPPGLGALHPDLPLVRTHGAYLSALEQPLLAATLFGEAVDLFHATSFSLPGLWPGPLVATLHDANHLALQENYGRAQMAYYRLVVAPRAKRALALLTVSEFSRQQLAAHLFLDPHRLQVVHNGVDARFHPQAASEVLAFRRRSNLPDHFLLLAGNQKAHKNLALLAKVANALPLPLVLLAGKGAAKALRFPSGTRELGEVPEDELPLLYSAADALMFPSLYEGFGLPALEAMACGCPVIASRTSSLPEVCGEAALLVDEPKRADAWREAAQRLTRDPVLRRTLAERGLIRAALFSWDDTAKQTLAAYRRALESASRTGATRPSPHTK